MKFLAEEETNEFKFHTYLYDYELKAFVPKIVQISPRGRNLINMIHLPQNIPPT